LRRGSADGTGDGAIGGDFLAREEDDGAGFGGESAGLGDGVDEGGIAHGLEGERAADGADDADGSGAVLGDGDADDGGDEDLGGFEFFGEFVFEFDGLEAGGGDAVAEEGQGECAVGTDAEAAGEFGAIGDDDGDEVVGADGLGGQHFGRGRGGHGCGARGRVGSGGELLLGVECGGSGDGELDDLGDAFDFGTQGEDLLLELGEGVGSGGLGAGEADDGVAGEGGDAADAAVGAASFGFFVFGDGEAEADHAGFLV
jgi:hypothetical protein